MVLSDFLRLRGADLASILVGVRGVLRLTAEDVLLAVGSIAEHLGNSKSDLDLLLITPRNRRTLRLGDSVALAVGRCLIDLQVIRLGELEQLLTRFETWSESSWEVAHAAKFSLEERLLLHRLLHGQRLFVGQRERLSRRTPRRIDLARLKLHVARQMSRTIQVDMVGYREVGDYRSLGFAAQELLGHAVDALCAGYQLTNPRTKWRSRMLDLVPSNWESALMVRPTRFTLGQQVWRLHRTPEKPVKALSLEHALRIATFARAVFLWAERQLVHKRCTRVELNAWPRAKCRSRDGVLPYLDFDVDFFFWDRRVALARLNEFTENVELSDNEFILLPLLDGVTTAHEAKIALFGSATEAKSKNIHGFISRLVEAGLTISPNHN